MVPFVYVSASPIRLETPWSWEGPYLIILSTRVQPKVWHTIGIKWVFMRKEWMCGHGWVGGKEVKEGKMGEEGKMDGWIFVTASVHTETKPNQPILFLNLLNFLYATVAIVFINNVMKCLEHSGHWARLLAGTLSLSMSHTSSLLHHIHKSLATLTSLLFLKYTTSKHTVCQGFCTSILLYLEHSFLR